MTSKRSKGFLFAVLAEGAGNGEEAAQGEHELVLAGVAEGGGYGDDAEGSFGDEAEVEILAGDGLLAGGVHLADLVGGAKVDALAERGG